MSYDGTISRMAQDAVRHVGENHTIGLGSGRAATALVSELGKVASKLHVRGVPTSLQIRLVAERLGIPMLYPGEVSRLDVAFDGADQIDSKGYMIKGGGGALLQENILAAMAAKLVIMADETKFVQDLCRSVPVEVHPAARALVAARVQEMDGVPTLRTIHHGYPAFTENGNVILDCDFGVIHDPPVLASRLHELPGVLEAGIFARPDLIYRADADGFSVIKPLS